MMAASALRPKCSSIRPFTISHGLDEFRGGFGEVSREAGGFVVRRRRTVALERSRDSLLDCRCAHDAGRDLASDGIGAIGRNR